MSKRQSEWKIIPAAATAIALVAYAAMIFVILKYLLPGDPEAGKMPEAARVAMTFLVPLVVATYVLLIGYVYGDAKRRQMRYILWTLLSIFIPNAIGIILYFILRDPLPEPCPSCATLAKPGYVFCPNCGFTLKPTCPQCGKAVERTWANCAYCGTKLNQPAQAA